MKVYIAIDQGHEHTRILGIYEHFEDAKQMADKRKIAIDKEWEEDFGKASRWPSKVMIESGPSDSTCVIDYEVQEWFNVERDTP